MRKRFALAAIAALALALVGTTAFAGSPRDRATGGGQILVGTQGAGNTIAFTAQGTSSDATGQVQVVDRSGGKGQSQVKFHGIVDCLSVEVTAAEILGHKRDNPSDTFSLFVQDNGEGAAANADIIALDDTPADSTCDVDPDDDDAAVDLARGNAQVYKAP
jgi:hypothetical protein